MKLVPPITALVASMTLSQAASAQLAAADCEFTRICQVQMLCNSDVLAVRYGVDLTTGEGFAEGNNGRVEAIVFRGYAALSFVEVLLSGAVQTTTINISGHALHSRHTTFGGNSPESMVPAQYRGECELSGWP